MVLSGVRLKGYIFAVAIVTHKLLIKRFIIIMVFFLQLILNTEITKVINIYIHTGIVFMKADCSTNVQLFIHT